MNEEEMVRKSLKELANSIFSKLDDVEKTYLVMVNNEKNKQINDLQQELQRKDNIINDLKSSIVDYQEAVGDYQDELKRKDNNWNELKEWLNNRSEFTNMGAVIDKIKELEK